MKSKTVVSETFYRIIDESVLHHHKLMLPDEFVQKYSGELSNVVRINVPVDRIWLIGVERAGQTRWLQDGWEAFMECHSICFGHFLIFNYKGNSKFDLHIFDITATEIQYPFTKARSPNHASQNSGQEKNKFGLYNDDSMVDSSLQIFMATSLELDAQHENTAKGVQGVKARENIDRSSREHDVFEGIQGRKRAFRATTSEPNKPSFTVTMKPYNVERSFIVPIPSEFVKENLSNDIDYIELQDSDSKKWPVRCIRSSSKTTYLSKGWLPFARANKLVKGDICVFELIHENEAMLKVSIFPAKNNHAR